MKNNALTKTTAEPSWSATRKEQRAYRSLRSFPNKIAHLYAHLHNALIDLLRRSPRIQSCSSELNEILCRAEKRTDISDHLPTLFHESLRVQPRLIVELGVREGESTFVFQRVAKCCGAKGVSVDIEPFPGRQQDERWQFVQSDDIAFAKRFPVWSRENGIPNEIDILFVDTTHFYEHTVQEIEYWFPLLALCAKVFFHDTNLRRIYFRKDGSVGVAWKNRGVTEALENYLGKRFNEKGDFIDSANGWSIRHFANCSGLTILSREMHPIR